MHGLRFTPIAFLLAALMLLVAACGGGAEVSVEPVATATQAPAETQAAVVAAAASSATATPRATATVAASPEPTPTPEPYDGELVAMRIPALEVDAAIERVGINRERNELDVPDDPHNVAWYHRYGKPGIDGDTIYSAHKDYWPDIRGPFFALTELNDGDEIVLVMDDGREYVYEVFFQQRYLKDDVPMRDLIHADRAEDPELLRPADEEWITLITCGGEFVATSARGSGDYLHRDIVIARRVDRPSDMAAANVP